MPLPTIKLLPTLALVVSSVLSNSALASEPAWCETTELSSTELTICNEPTLSKADLLVDQMYKAVLSFRGMEGHEGMWPGEIISNQRDFLEQRNKLTKKSDILTAYTQRINALSNMLQLRWQPG